MSNTSPHITFRTAQARHVHAVVALVQAAYRGDASRIGWTTEADLLDGQRTDVEAVSALIAAPATRILLGEQGRELLASAHLEKDEAICHFGMFAVRPSRQGGGIGKLVLAESERIARDEWDCQEMQMVVISLRTELIAWYERRGYQRTGVFKPFPYGNARFGIPKRTDLRMVELRKTIGDLRK